MSCPICQKEHTYTISEALAVLSSTPRKLERACAGLSPKRAAVRPAPDKWSPKEIICHLSDCELVYGFRYRKILAEPGATLVAFDQNAWADGLCYRDQPLKNALASFSALRTGHVALFKSLPEEAWDKGAVHAEYGQLTLRQLTFHLADHDRNHTAQVERLCPPLPKPAKKSTAKSKAKPRSRR
jgi:hypothetical protein